MFRTPITQHEVEDAIQHLKLSKAGGWDEITSEHFIYGGTLCSQVCMHLFNALIENQYVPKHFRKGVKVPIFKGGRKDMNECDSYRGITLMPVFSKLYENVLLLRSRSWFENCVNKCQGVAQSKCSSLHTSLLLRETITHLVEGGSKAYVALLDAKQAFDCVWIDGLFAQLYEKGIDFTLWKILRAYYKDVECCVRVGGSVSDWFNVQQGVHQGGVLSAKLYQVFIDSLFDVLYANGVKCMVYGIDCQVMAYADDVTLVSLSPYGLQTNLNLVYEHSKKWRYCHNAHKSQVLIFGGKTKKVNVLL